MISQNQILLRHFKKTKSISQREALLDYSIQCLSKRIQELRDAGYTIETQHKRHPTTGQRYARYVLKK
jgi:biotin operon repressor